MTNNHLKIELNILTETSQKNIQMANEHMKRGSTLFVIG